MVFHLSVCARREEEPKQSPEADPMDIPEGPLPSPLRSPAAAEDAREERRHRSRRARSPVDSERLYRKFGGAYPALVEVLLQLRPQPVSGLARRDVALRCTNGAVDQWISGGITAQRADLGKMSWATREGMPARFLGLNVITPVLQVGAMGARLLCRLRAYEQAASFQVGCLRAPPYNKRGCTVLVISRQVMWQMSHLLAFQPDCHTVS